MEEYRGSVSIHVKGRLLVYNIILLCYRRLEGHVFFLTPTGSGKSKRVAKERAAENALDLVQLFARAIASEPQRPTEDVD